jgi:hypothetical protein
MFLRDEEEALGHSSTSAFRAIFGYYTEKGTNINMTRSSAKTSRLSQGIFQLPTDHASTRTQRHGHLGRYSNTTCVLQSTCDHLSFEFTAGILFTCDVNKPTDG